MRSLSNMRFVFTHILELPLKIGLPQSALMFIKSNI